ncbi:MAG: transcriptional regulator, TetR family protein [Solirubrobacterales bacterium]|nr:transcriptional regulator, TetR family protein [Solirubrobacterales bacterium]
MAATRDKDPAARATSEDGHALRVRRTRDRILGAATQAFGRDGYGAATIDAIAATAGVAPASVYNHFASKAGIAQALAERSLGVHDEYLAPAWALDVSPLERLIAAGGATLAFAREQPTLSASISLSFLGPLGLFPADTPAAEAIAARRRRQLERIVANLEAAVASKELRPLNASATSRFLMASFAGVLTMEAHPAGATDPAATLGAGLRAMIQGLGAPATLTGDGRLRARYARALERHGLVATHPETRPVRRRASASVTRAARPTRRKREAS